ncbi:hypothetical protein [Thermosporothrix hazakensis]|uniref:hypothetical protein n=1 Tax=Thermosporothrix hazakensis TaxID=644383 RepID=UPI001474C45E|nr:hypothetical protein [Thermosporothrix hazakensis]
MHVQNAAKRTQQEAGLPVQCPLQAAYRLDRGSVVLTQIRELLEENMLTTDGK